VTRALRTSEHGLEEVDQARGLVARQPMGHPKEVEVPPEVRWEEEGLRLTRSRRGGRPSRFATLESARAFAGSPELKAAMNGAGVTSAPTMWFATRA